MRKGEAEAADERGAFSTREALSPYKSIAARKLTSQERTARSEAMRKRLPNPQAVHDAKLWPKP